MAAPDAAPSGPASASASSREQLLQSRKLAFTLSQAAAATQLAPSGAPHPKAQAQRAAALNSTVSIMSSAEPPHYTTQGVPLAPGRGSGVHIASSDDRAATASGQFRADLLFNAGAGALAVSAASAAAAAAAASAAGGSTAAAAHAEGVAVANVGGRPPPKPTLSGMRHARKMAQRADPSFDLDGDGTVSQTDFFFATRFDSDGDGNLTQDEKVEARKIMKEDAKNFVFLKGGAPADSFAHRVMQKDGVVLSEQLDGGWAQLTRAKNVGPGGTAMGGATGSTTAGAGGGGGGLPFAVQDAAGALVKGTGAAGLEQGKVDIDMDDTDNVALMHTRGAVISYDNVVVKPGYREELSHSGERSLSALKFRRKMAQRADISFDLDGDGMVSQKDFFFATRFDKDGSGVLDERERVMAAEAMHKGFGTQLTFMRTSGPSDKHHRVMQKDGVILSEETAGGFGALTTARKEGSTVRTGADGNLKDEVEGGRPAGAKMAHNIVMTDEGRVAMMHVKGVVYDFDTVPTKPQFRPELVQSGSTTRSELLMRRRRAKYPDLSMDLDGDGAVSQADYWFSKRYDVDDDDNLDSAERDKALRDYKDGYTKRFVTLSSSGPQHRVQQRGSVVVREGEGVLGEHAEQHYDASVRLATLGIVPALDLPADRRLQPGMLTRAAAESAGRSSESGGKPVAVNGMGIVPGVQRVVLRLPDGSQESYGGYAGGMGAGPLNNCSSTLAAVMGVSRGPGSGPAEDREEADRTMRETLRLQDEVPPPRPMQMTSFALRGQPTDVWMHAPYALAGEGGVREAYAADPELAANKDVAVASSLLTRTQLLAARRVRSQNAEQNGGSAFEASAAGSVSDLLSAAAVRTGSAAASSSLAGSSALNAGEEAMRSALTTTTTPGNLPAYMLRAVENRNLLPVITEDLHAETIKPMSLTEGVRTHEATRASALAAVRSRDLKLAALEATGQAPDAVAVPELYGAEYSDHHAHGHPLVADGQVALSKTQSQLGRRRLAERFNAALKWMPPEPYGVHAGPLPSFARKLNGSLTPWYEDKSHLKGVRTTFEGSPLSGPRREDDAAVRSVKDYIDPIPPEFDPNLRHTVRDAHRAGESFAPSGSMASTRSGLGARSPRRIVSGALHESEDAAATDNDPFKTRTIHPRKLDAYLRKHGLNMADKPSHIDPWALARAQRDDPSVFVPAFALARPGGREAHMIHKNVTAANNCVPGPHPDLTHTLDSIKAGQMWSSAVIEYKQRMEPSTEHLDASGKETRLDPKEVAPMFSSFTADGVFREKFVEETLPFAPASPQVVRDVPARRNSVYGRSHPVPSSAGGVGVGAGGGFAPPSASLGGEGGGGGDSSAAFGSRPSPLPRRRGSVDTAAIAAASAAAVAGRPLMRLSKQATRAAVPERLTTTLSAQLASTAASASATGGVRTRGFL